MLFCVPVCTACSVIFYFTHTHKIAFCVLQTNVMLFGRQTGLEEDVGSGPRLLRSETEAVITWKRVWPEFPHV